MRKSKAAIIGKLKSIPWFYVGSGTLSAALLVLSFPSYSAWGLAFVGMVPFLLALFRARNFKEAFWLGFSCMVAFIWLGFGWVGFVATNFGGLHWIVGRIVLLLFSLFEEGQYLLFALIGVAALGRMTKLKSQALRAVILLLGFPLVFIGLDYLYPKIFPSAFGYVLYDWFELAQTAEYVGIYGLTFPILVVNMALALLIRPLLPRAASAATLTLVAVGLLTGHLWGKARLGELAQIENDYQRKLKISIIQANIGDMDKLASESGFEPAVQRVLGTYNQMTLDSIRRFKPDLVIWPETAYPFLYTHFKSTRANRSGAARDIWMYELMQRIKTPLYFGSYTSDGKKDYNSAYLLEPPYELTAVYKKWILLAFGEYVPLGPLSPLVQSLVPSIADFGRGPGPTVVDFQGIKFAPQICYEGIYPEHPRQGVEQGADVMLNITNDSWFGDTTEPWLHLRLTAFRSIELRRPLIRATNTGISTIIDITGDARYRTRLFEPETLEAELKLPAKGQSAPETFYLRNGELLARVSALLAIVVAAFLFLPALAGKVGARRAR